MRSGSGVLHAIAAILLCLWFASGVVRGQDNFDRAAAFGMAGDHQAALQEYESFLAEHPHDRLAPVAAIAAVNIHFLALEDHEAAVRACDRVLTDYHESAWAPDAARRKGECLQIGEEWAAAGEAYRQALELSGCGESDVSTDWVDEVSLAAADCYYQLGDHGEVVETYERALKASLPPHSTATVLYRLGDCYESDGEIENAARNYARIIEEYPFAPAFDQAMTKRELITQCTNLDLTPYLMYAQTAQDLRNRDFAGALQRTDEILSGTDNEVLRMCTRHRKIVAETMISGNFTEGARELAGLLAGLSDQRSMPDAQQRLERFAAIAELEAQARAGPDDAAALRVLGRAYLRSGAIPRAVETLEQARALAPDDAQVHQLLGHAYAAAGRNEEAGRAFGVYLQENPNDTTALNIIGYTYLNLGDAERAVSYFRRYAEIAPEEANAHDSLGEGCLGAGRLDEAAAEYERAVAIDPSFFNSHFMLGEIYRQLEQNEKAAAAYERFLELAPTDLRGEQARTALRELEGE